MPLWPCNLSGSLAGGSWETLKDMYKLFLNGLLVLEPHRPRTISTKREIAKAWVHQIAIKIGDKMPGGVEIHLPCWLNNKILYEMMKDDLGKQEESTFVSYSLFCTIMSTDFPDVKIPKVCFVFPIHSI